MPNPQSQLHGPAKGFSVARAQKWVLACALITAVTYAFRAIIEPSTPSSSTAKTTAGRLAGKGAPPTLEHWAVAYTAAFLMLSALAMAAPELAASLAMIATLGNVLTNGASLTADLNQIEGKTSTVKAAR